MNHAAMKHSADGHMLMDGTPVWMGIVGLMVIILATHWLLHYRKTSTELMDYRRWRIFRFKWVARLVNKTWFPLLVQSASIFFFMLVIAAGLIGNDKHNIGPVITWTWWWVLLIFLAMGFGKVFCMICPWEGISSMVTSLSFRSRVKKLGFDLPWPKWARNIFPAIIFFIILTWFELGRDITRSAMWTSILGLIMVGMAVLSAIVFEKRSFCRYGCLVGRISGLYSLFAPLELRAASAQVCRDCHTKECYTGTEASTACPTFLFPSKLRENSYCTLCTECVRSCPHDNLEINFRPIATDLKNKTHFQWDESVLAVVLLSLTSFHGLTMTPHWTHWNGVIRADTGLGASTVFTALMGLMILLPIALFWGGAKIARTLAGETNVTAPEIFKAFSYSLIPIALFYHLAHNCMHFFMEAQHIVPLLSDPFGFAWNLFGTAGKHYPPLLSLGTIWYLQIICVVIGHLYGVVMANRFSHRLFGDSPAAFRSLIPLIFTMILYSSLSIWLIMQPMDMRSAM